MRVAVYRFSIDIDDVPTDSGSRVHRQRREVAGKLNEIRRFKSAPSTLQSKLETMMTSTSSDDEDHGDMPPVPVADSDSDDQNSSGDERSNSSSSSSSSTGHGSSRSRQ